MHFLSQLPGSPFGAQMTALQTKPRGTTVVSSLCLFLRERKSLPGTPSRLLKSQWPELPRMAHPTQSLIRTAELPGRAKTHLGVWATPSTPLYQAPRPDQNRGRRLVVPHTQGGVRALQAPGSQRGACRNKRTWWERSPLPCPLWERTDSNGARTVPGWVSRQWKKQRHALQGLRRWLPKLNSSHGLGGGSCQVSRLEEAGYRKRSRLCCLMKCQKSKAKFTSNVCGPNLHSLSNFSTIQLVCEHPLLF